MPHKIQGIGAGFVPANLDLTLVDRVETVTSESEAAITMAHRLMQEEGILCGISCGAAVVAAVRLGRLLEYQERNIVVILPDSAERYLSSALFEGALRRAGERAVACHRPWRHSPAGLAFDMGGATLGRRGPGTKHARRPRT